MMKISPFKRPSDPTPLGKAEKRVAALPTSELPTWADTCLFQAGRSLSAYSRDRTPEALAEANEAVDTLAVILKEMQRRHVAFS